MANIEKLDHDQVKFTVKVDPKTFADALQKAFLKEGKKFNVPGFRKGKAPRNVIEKMYGEGAFYDDAFDICSGEAYENFVKENKLDAVGRPQLESIDKMSKEEGLEFKVSVQLKPTVKLGKYKGVEVEKPDFTVKDSDVDAVIESEREKNARFIDVDREVKDGDRVVIDYSGSVDGVKFEGGTAEKQNLVIGSKTFIPGFEEQLVGMKKDEEKDINVKFPDEYDPKLAGKDAVFHIKLHNIQIKELPALDDEFAKDISEFDTMKELKESKKKELEEDAAKREKNMTENLVVKAAAENATLEIPECMIDEQAENLVREMEWRMQMSGISMADYCKYMGIKPEELKKEYYGEAEIRVKNSLVLEQIAKEEKISCSDAELEEAIAETAKSNGMEVEDFKKSLNDGYKEYLKETKVTDKTIKLLCENAKFVKAKAKVADDKPKKAAAKTEEKAEKPAAKKTAAKKAEEK